MTNKRTITYQTIIYVVCILLSVIVLVPFIMMFVNSFKGIRESALFRISLPKKTNLDKLQDSPLQTLFLAGNAKFPDSFHFSDSSG